MKNLQHWEVCGIPTGIPQTSLGYSTNLPRVTGLYELNLQELYFKNLQDSVGLWNSLGHTTNLARVTGPFNH